VLSLDVWRAIDRTDALQSWSDWVMTSMSSLTDASFDAARRTVAALPEFFRMHAARTDPVQRERDARRFAFGIARVTAVTRILSHVDAVRSDSETERRLTTSASAMLLAGLARGLAVEVGW
jgi:hypothetical protein